MLTYVLKRLAVVVPLLILITFASFELINFLPGDPTTTLCGIGCTAQAKAKLIHQLGLDKSVLVRYWIYLKNLSHLDFGNSYSRSVPVSTELAQTLPVTLEIMVLSQILALVIAIPIAIYSALRPESLFDRVTSGFSFGMLAIPSLVVGVLLQEVFAVRIHVFGATGYTPLTQNVFSNLKSLVLPTITLGIGSIAVYHRVLRSDLINTLQEDFITMAKAKGLPIRYIMFRHALRPSTLTLMTLVGLNVGALIGGAFIVEFIFQLPGIGLLTINAINQRDYLTVQGVVLIATFGFVVFNLLVDVFTAVIDPRIRREGAAA